MLAVRYNRSMMTVVTIWQQLNGYSELAKKVRVNSDNGPVYLILKVGLGAFPCRPALNSCASNLTNGDCFAVHDPCQFRTNVAEDIYVPTEETLRQRKALSRLSSSSSALWIHQRCGYTPAL